jgi:hypothetical protein
VNTDELALELYRAERRVLEIQTKVHSWAGDDPHRRFDDLFNLVTDPEPSRVRCRLHAGGGSGWSSAG